jgi:hypothetical protein
LQQPLKSVRSYDGRLGHFAKTGGTQYFVIMLRDALPAEKPAALRTAGHSFPQHVVVATLVSEILHVLIITMNLLAKNYLSDEIALRLQ